MPAPYRRLGKIIKVHGTQGEVTVAPRDGLSLSLLGGIDVWIVPPPGSGAIARRMRDLRPTAKGVLVRISGIETQAEAHEVVGRHLLARGAELPADAFETPDLTGYEVTDVRRGYIGSIAEVIVTGANDVLVCEGGPFGQVLVPVIDDVILSVDADGSCVHVALLEGLIDEDEE